MNTKIIRNEDINKDVDVLLSHADIIINNTIRKINYDIINMYWNLGKLVSDYKKDNSSKHGDYVVKTFVEKLYISRGSGFNRSNIYYATQFYELFSNVHARGQIKNVHARYCSFFRFINQKFPIFTYIISSIF